MAPDRDFTYMSDALFNQAPHLQTAIALAHEMQHVRQYRRLGTDNFKCQYSRQPRSPGGIAPRLRSPVYPGWSIRRPNPKCALKP
jgi:hypothetical protein